MNLKLYNFNFNNQLTDNFSKTNLTTNIPLVYIIHDEKLVYIGETANIKNRMKSHLSNIKRKHLTDVTIIESDEFNKSATYNIETNLINYFLADEKYKIQNAKQIKQKVIHNYYQKEYYNNQLFTEIWNRLKQIKIVDNNLETLENKDIFKLSPFKELSEEQYDLKLQIIETARTNIKKDKKTIFFISGDAGTGKSVLISSIYNALQLKSLEIGVFLIFDIQSSHQLFLLKNLHYPYTFRKY